MAHASAEKIDGGSGAERPFASARVRAWMEPVLPRGMSVGLERVDRAVRPWALVSAVFGALVVGCAPAVGPGEGASLEEQAPAAPADDEAPTERSQTGSFEVEIDGGAPVPARALAPSGPGHVVRPGWTPDGRFEYCHGTEASCRDCTLWSRDGTVETVTVGSGCSDGARSEPGPLDAGAERWAFGDDVVLVVQTDEVESGHGGQARPLLQVGARRRDGGAPVWLLQVDPCQGCGIDQVCTGAAHLDALSLSPDGERVVALVHQRSNDGREELRLESFSAKRLADAALVPASSSGR